jgi:hypothetical protein
VKTLSSSKRWHEHFTGNYQGEHLLNWAEQVSVSAFEQSAITKSLQAFQLGESSEGLHLYRRVEEYSRQTGDVEYLEAMKLFIREEQRHARYLARFMELAGIPLARKIFIDAVFRGLRRLAGLECSISVLVTAEIIAKVYYRALHDATKSDFLRTICRQILSDEKMHVQFQSERLAILRMGRSTSLLALTVFAQRFLFAGTLVVVWIKCGRTFRAAGDSIASFFHDSWRELDLALEFMDYRSYTELVTSRVPFGNSCSE